jgi:hypothetical protein
MAEHRRASRVGGRAGRPKQADRRHTGNRSRNNIAAYSAARPSKRSRQMQNQSANSPAARTGLPAHPDECTRDFATNSLITGFAATIHGLPRGSTMPLRSVHSIVGDSLRSAPGCTTDPHKSAKWWVMLQAQRVSINSSAAAMAQKLARFGVFLGAVVLLHAQGDAAVGRWPCLL